MQDLLVTSSEIRIYGGGHFGNVKLYDMIHGTSFQKKIKIGIYYM